MTSPTLADLRPGDILFARHVSPKSADLLILAGQIFLGEPGYPHHVAVVTQAGTRLHDAAWHAANGFEHGFGPQVVQAMPSGAEEVEIGQEHWTKDFTYIRPAYEDDEGWHVASCARRYVKPPTPYSFLDYAALTGRHLLAKQPQDRTLLDRYVTSSKHQICSQLADQAMSDAGWHVFDDGRLAQDVTPSALYSRLIELPHTVIKPGG